MNGREAILIPLFFALGLLTGDLVRNYFEVHRLETPTPVKIQLESVPCTFALKNPTLSVRNDRVTALASCPMDLIDVYHESRQ